MSQIVSTLGDAVFGNLARLKEAGTPPPDDRAFVFLTFALAHCRGNQAQMAQDLWVVFETGGKRDGYFVEFGAGDGRRLSNTWLLEHEYGWTGVVAEPNPVFHEALRRERRCHVSTACVVGDDATEVVFNQTEDPHFSTIDSYSASDMHVTRRLGGNRISVPACSLAQLLAEAGAPRRIDYLSIDTEGSEYDILASFDFTAHDIGLITVEHNFGPRRAAIRSLLEGHGFSQRFTGLTRFDDWYVGPSLAKAA